MKKIASFLLLFVLVVPLFSEDAVTKAKACIQKEKERHLVEKAKTLLERKAVIEAEMKQIDDKLAKLAAGEDVKVKEDLAIPNIYFSNGGTLMCCTNNSSFPNN